MFFTIGAKGLAKRGFPSRGRSIQPGRLCYINGCAVEVLTDWTPFSISGRESRMFFTIGAKGLAKRGFPPRGRSIQPGRLCYINGCAVEVAVRLDALQHLRPGEVGCSSPSAQRVSPERGFPSRGRSIQPGRLCYIKSGARSRWRSDWTPFQHLTARLDRHLL